MIPLLHDLTGERVLVFGGGSVGARRARTFAEEATVVVISPAFGDREFGGASLVRARPSPADVDGWIERAAPALVVAATDDEAVNDGVAAAARERGLPFNRADRSGERDHRNVAVPSIVRDGPVVVGLSTGSPALTRELRTRVEREVDGAGELAALTARLREDLRDEYSREERRTALRAVVRSERVWKALGSGDAKVDQIVVEIVTEQLGDSPW